MIRLVALALVFVGPVVADDRAVIDAVVEPLVKDKPYRGIVVGVSRGVERQVLGYGSVSLDGKPQRPADDTLFEIGSITKTFTGTLLADLVVAGVVRLDDPVQKHLPPGFLVPRRDDRDITLLHLTTHTSGLPVQPPLAEMLTLAFASPDDPYATYDVAKLRATLAGLKLDRPIGSKFEYSNLAVGLLGQALAHAAKMESYEALLQARLIGPLGLTDTGVQLPAELAKRLAPGHTKTGSPTSGWTLSAVAACGGIRSSARDMLTYLESAHGRRKSPLAAAFRLAQEPWRELPGKDQFIGLGWFRRKLPNGERVVVWHNGGTGGYRSFAALVPATGLCLVVLSNSSESVDEPALDILKRLDADVR